MGRLVNLGKLGTLGKIGKLGKAKFSERNLLILWRFIRYTVGSDNADNRAERGENGIQAKMIRAFPTICSKMS